MINLQYGLLRAREKGWLNILSAISRMYLKGLGVNILSALCLRFLKKKKEYEFKIVQIQTLSGCNYSCGFCPIGKTKLPSGKMTMTLYMKIIDELKDFRGIIHPYLSNEPLLDKRIVELCRIAKEKTCASIIIQTNGSLLTKDLAAELSRYAFIIVNDYTENNEVIKKIKGYGIKKNIILLDRNPRAILSNRAGNVPGMPEIQLNASCVRPFEQLYISFDGKVPLCCQDWKVEEVMGDLTFGSLKEVWENEKFSSVRQRLLRKERDGLCSKCDFPGV